VVIAYCTHPVLLAARGAHREARSRQLVVTDTIPLRDEPASARNRQLS